MSKLTDKKVYKDMYLVASGSSEEFMKKLSEVIDDYQIKGLQVDVQYGGLSNGQITALIMAY